MKRHFGLFVVVLGTAASLRAAPQLRLTQTAVGLTIVTPGQDGPTQSVDAGNIGDGTLNLTVTASVPWIAPTLGQPHNCSFSDSCVPILIGLQTASLGNGSYTGTVTVSDPNAIDSPQTITVTISIGTSVPDNLEFFVQPGGSATSPTFYTATQGFAGASDSWLSITVAALGSFQFNVPYQVTVTPTPDMGEGDYNGTVSLGGSALPDDNKTIQVLMHVTTQPIAQASPTSLAFLVAQGGLPQTGNIYFGNGGQGTLALNGTTTPGDAWLSAQINGNQVTVTADPSGLSPGVYKSSVTVNSNAANANVTIPVQFTVEPPGPPTIFFGSAVNILTGDTPLAQGDLVAITGDQLSAGAPTDAQGFPIATQLNDTQVLVNGQPAPVLHTSANYAVIQIPYGAGVGQGVLQAITNGQPGNMISINIVPDAPRIGQLQDATSLQTVGDPMTPVAAGQTLILNGIVFVQTNPPATEGAAASTDPTQLQSVPLPQVCFGFATPFSSNTCVTATSAVLTPGNAGWYQITFTVPSGLQSGIMEPVYVQTSDATTNTIYVSLQ